MKKILSILFICVLTLSLFLNGCVNAPVSQQTTHSHTDANDDGICDDCKESVLINIDFYAINDLHGKFDNTDTQPGVDEMTTYLRAAKFANENTILISSGDMWQGSSESNLTKGYLITDWMNELDFTAMTLGNHEFDWGEDIIKENQQIADFPFLGINIYSRQTDQRVSYCEPSVMVDMGEVQIGIIGAIGDCYSSIAPDWTKEIYFVVGNQLTALVKAEADKLRKEGADFIIYSIHDGYGGNEYSSAISENMLEGYYDIALSDGYVDMVFEAHTHKYYVKQDIHGVYHLQGGGDNQGIVFADIDINPITGSSFVNHVEFIGKEKYSNYSPDPAIPELLEKYNTQISYGKRILGYNSANRSGDEIRQICADLYYDFGIKHWGEEYDILLGGGFFSVRSPGYLQFGDVTYAQLQTILPFDNQLVLCSIQGKDLKEKFVETDNTNYYISYAAEDSALVKNLDPNAIYYVVVDSYTSTYAPNRLTEIERYGETVYARDLLAEYIEQGLLN